MSITERPELRQVEFQPYPYQGEELFLLRDPLQLSDQQLLLPPLLAQMALLCDGTRTLPEVQALLSEMVEFEVPLEPLQETLAKLDGVFLLENGRSRQARQQRRAAYRDRPHRPPLLAGRNYPADPQELSAFLNAYSQNDRHNGEWQGWQGKAIVSPHIDYQRGGETYAKVWGRAADAVAEAELVLMFATDHNGGLGSLTLTPLPYATPYGVIPTDSDLVSKLAAAIGEDEAYRLELNHTHEHSVELSAVWLHHAARQAGVEVPPMVPLLIGSFQHFVTNGGHPRRDETLEWFVETLKWETQGKRVLCVASVDLSHVGPAFQDDYIMDQARREALIEADHSLMEAVAQGDVERFYNEIAAVQDSNKVCGFTPLYFMLRYLEDVSLKGHAIDYRHCAADAQDHSLVSICGLLLE